MLVIIFYSTKTISCWKQNKDNLFLKNQRKMKSSQSNKPKTLNIENEIVCDVLINKYFPGASPLFVTFVHLPS